MKSKTHRCVVHVIADLPSDMTRTQFSRIVERRMRHGGLPALMDLPLPMAFRLWHGSSKSQRRTFRKLVMQYIDLGRQHAQAAKRPPVFDEATGRKFVEEMLRHWDAGNEQGLFWLGRYVDLLQTLLERNIREKADNELWDALCVSVEDRNVIIAQYELMVHKLLGHEVKKH